ncbi:hypothetical protein [Streptomyces sp. NPDC037389]|uniref:hypothetical protein n=1 Tax=Streptomyces sp. NPDC037389 TaxID=3155369 RepID=UPI0034049BCF
MRYYDVPAEDFEPLARFIAQWDQNVPRPRSPGDYERLARAVLSAFAPEPGSDTGPETSHCSPGQPTQG